ncbi:methionyl-tRNA formyltransferase [Haladaptatus sp. NG-WS-4]
MVSDSSNDRSLRILIVTVDEYYYIPTFLRDIVAADDVNVVNITTVSPALGTESLVEFVPKLLQRFGLIGFFQHSVFYGSYFILDKINRILGSGRSYSPETLAKRNEIAYRHERDVNRTEYVEYAESMDPDVIVSVAATQKFHSDLLDVPNRCVLNVHSSLLPHYRGVSPSFWSLLNDEEKTGVSVHYMDENIDTGDVILQEELEIHPDDTLHTLNSRVAQHGSTVLHESLRQISEGVVDPTPTDPSKGSYYSMPTREDVREFRQSGNRFY